MSALGEAGSGPATAETAPPATETVETFLHVEGVTCAACVARVESALARIPQVREARLNLATRRARIVHARDLPLTALTRALAAAGYRAGEARDREGARRDERRRSLWRLALAAFAMMQIMMFALPAYIADEGTLSADVERLFALAGLALIVPVLLVSARPIFAAAWAGLRRGDPGMDLPVALGILAAFAASLHNTFSGGDVYYDSIAMFVCFLLAARHLESEALAHTANASEALAALLPRRARRKQGTAHEEVECGSLAVGDIVMVAVGEAAPADLLLESGGTEFDEALVTGESAPVPKLPGDSILAGTINLVAPIEARVARCGGEQTLERIERLVERAAADKPRWALAADRVARHFAWIVIALAALGAAAWSLADPSRALWVAVATLVVSCPCALSLAAPATVSAALGRLARGGVLATRARALETLAGVTHFVFDKTGTLTTGRLRLAKVETLGRREAEACLGIAAALEAALPHPIAHALAGAQARSPVAADSLKATPGAGVEGSVAGRRYRIGSADYCAALCSDAAMLAVDDRSAAPLAILVDEEEVLAILHFEDTLRPEASELVTRLRQAGCEVVLLSGDRRAVVEPIAAALGIRERVAGATPEAKARFVERLTAMGARVAMVGDGVNDAPVLAIAPVAIALGQGAAAAQSQADFIVLNSSITAIADALAVAKRARAIIRQNLAWAIAYNAIALPLALGGFLTPWLASLGMSLSSLLVVGNALRLLSPATRHLAPATSSLSPATCHLPPAACDPWTSSISSSR